MNGRYAVNGDDCKGVILTKQQTMELKCAAYDLREAEDYETWNENDAVHCRDPKIARESFLWARRQTDIAHRSLLKLIRLLSGSDFTTFEVGGSEGDGYHGSKSGSWRWLEAAILRSSSMMSI